MERERLNKIRWAEQESHLEVYNSRELYKAGSWLAKPVKTVMELIPLFAGCREFRALDLGCGVGRNSIALAQAFENCIIECVDILPFAIEKLCINAEQYQVAGKISGIAKPIDEFHVEENAYNLILGISALEHMDSEQSFLQKLEEIQRGLCSGGVFCLIVNTDVTEHDATTGAELQPQFEVNLPTDRMIEILETIFAGWEVLKRTVNHQSYEIPRGERVAALETDVITWVVRKK